MKKAKFIFYLVFFLFHLFLFIFTLVVDKNKNDFDFLFALQSQLTNLKYFAFFGLLLFLADFVMANLAIRGRRIEAEKLKNDYNALKANMFDIEHKEDVKNPEIDVDEGDKPKVANS